MNAVSIADDDAADEETGAQSSTDIAYSMGARALTGKDFVRSLMAAPRGPPAGKVGKTEESEDEGASFGC